MAITHITTQGTHDNVFDRLFILFARKVQCLLVFRLYAEWDWYQLTQHQRI